MAGGITSTLLVGWISVGTQAAMAKGIIVNPTKPVSTEECLIDVSFVTNITETIIKEDYIDRWNFLIFVFEVFGILIIHFKF